MSPGDHETLALIPARGGSKSVPHKNIRSMLGKPMMAHSIEQAHAARTVTRTIVSTDSALYAEIARTYGAEAPFLRPAEFAEDNSTDLEVFQHALSWLREQESYVPEFCLHLRPTHPVRKIEDIDAIVQLLIDRPDLDSVRSIVLAPETPYKMWSRSGDGLLAPILTDGPPEAYNMPRQALPQVFLQAASIDAVRSRVVVECNSMTGEHIYGYAVSDMFDIDTESDFDAACERLREAGVATGGIGGDTAVTPLTLCFDMDGVICTLAPTTQYDIAQPREDVVALMRSLHELGHRIVIATARGSTTGIDWGDLTRRQLAQWGVPYHDLHFGKPAADLYIDDRIVSAAQLKRMAGGPTTPDLEV